MKGRIVHANKVITWIIDYLNNEKDWNVLTFISERLAAIIKECTSFDDHITYSELISKNMYTLLTEEKDAIYSNLYAKFLISYSMSDYANNFY